MVTRWPVWMQAEASIPATAASAPTVVRRLSCAERDRWERRRDRWQELEQKSQRETDARATALLLSLLDEANRSRYEDARCIHVTGSAGGHYQINCLSFAANVRRLDDGRTFCAHPEVINETGERLPVAASVIAQMLMLQHDEPGFLEVANEIIWHWQGRVSQ